MVVETALKGRLADVYMPALVSGAVAALSHRLGEHATIDDPVFGRASSSSSIDLLLGQISTRFRDEGASYEHIASATGVDRDVSEGVITMNGAVLPVVVVAERRRLREIELRVYYASGASPRKPRPPLLNEGEDVAIPQIVVHVLEALRKGAVERVLAAFEEGSRWVAPSGATYGKKDGAMASFIAELGGRMEFIPAGAADDGRTCCVEAVVTRQRPLEDPEPAALSFQRGESGLLRELRLYYEP